MGGLAGERASERDDLTERVYYSRRAWRGGAIPRWCFRFSLTVAGGGWIWGFLQGLNTQVRKKDDNREPQTAGESPLCLSECSCGPDMISFSWCGAVPFNGGCAGAPQPGVKRCLQSVHSADTWLMGFSGHDSDQVKVNGVFKERGIQQRRVTLHTLVYLCPTT